MLIDNLRCLKETKAMDMIRGKCIPLFSVAYVVGTLWNCHYDAIPKCTHNIFLLNICKSFIILSFLNKLSTPFIVSVK